MSSLTSLGVNKNSTRFTPKVKARQQRRPQPPSKQESPATATATATATAAPVAEKSDNVAGNGGNGQANPSLPVTESRSQQQQRQQLQKQNSADLRPLVSTSAPSIQQDNWSTAPSPSADKTPFDVPAVATPGRPVQTPTPFDVSSPTFVDTPSPFMSAATPRRMSSDTEDMRPTQQQQPPPQPQPQPQPVVTPEAPPSVFTPATTASKAQPIATPGTTTAATVPAPPPKKVQSERAVSKHPRVARRGGAAPIVAPSRRSNNNNRPPAVGSSSSSSSSAAKAIAITIGESSTGQVSENSGDGSGAQEEQQSGKKKKEGQAKWSSNQEEQDQQQQQPARKKRHYEIDPAEWQTLDDVQDDPAPASYMEKPMSYFLRDLHTGIVSKAFKEREIEERQLKKRMESEALSKEEVDRLARLKQEAEERKRAEAEAKRIEEERRKEQESKMLRETSHAPQVRLINGQIVLDADSLVLERANEDQAIDMSTLEVVEENSMTRRVNSRTYSNQVHSARWSKLETEEFYDALAQCGTDFTMAAHLLPGRTRNQVRLKFNREERINPDRVKDVLVRKRKPVDIDRVQKAIGKELEALPESFYGASDDEL